MYVISHAQQHTAQKKERTQTKKDKNKENMNTKKRFQKKRTYSRQPKFAHNKKVKRSTHSTIFKMLVDIQAENSIWMVYGF